MRRCAERRTIRPDALQKWGSTKDQPINFPAFPDAKFRKKNCSEFSSLYKFEISKRFCDLEDSPKVTEELKLNLLECIAA